MRPKSNNRTIDAVCTWITHNRDSDVNAVVCMIYHQDKNPLISRILRRIESLGLQHKYYVHSSALKCGRCCVYFLTGSWPVIEEKLHGLRYSAQFTDRIIK